VTRDGGISEAAPALGTVGEFLNTLDERHFSLGGVQHTGGDGLASPGDLAAWLASHGLIPAGIPAGPADLAMARALREALRNLLKLRVAPDAADQTVRTGTAGDAVPDSLLGTNNTLDAHPLRVQADAYGTPVLLPASHGVPAALAAIAAAVALAQAAGTWKRLKICAAPDCRWVFYDTSRAGAARWCSMRVCGNRDKTRAYRQRRRDQGKILMTGTRR
jgi:predicted RNA-binding Zn ribbon-like protein